MDIEGYEEILLVSNLSYFKKNDVIIIVEVHSIEIENKILQNFDNSIFDIKVVDNDSEYLLYAIGYRLNPKINLYYKLFNYKNTL